MTSFEAGTGNLARAAADGAAERAAEPEPAAPEPVLEIADLRFARGPAPGDFRLHLPGLALHRGAFVALAGESGSGKTTLLDLLGLTAPPTGLRRFRLVRRDGTAADLTERLREGRLDALADLRRAAIGYILQQGGLLPFLTVAENLMLTAPPDRDPPMTPEEIARRLGISELLGRLPEALSIGQRQRVAIGRAIMGDPDLILADEPTAALDPPTARATLELLLELTAERDLAVIMASHSWSLIAEFDLPVLRATLRETAEGPTVAFVPGEAR